MQINYSRKQFLNKRVFFVIFLFFNIFAAGLTDAGNPGCVLADEKGKKTGKVFVPKDYKIPKAQKAEIFDENFSMNIFARKFAQGDFVYAELIPVVSEKEKNIKDVKLTVNGVEQPLTKKAWGYRTFFVIPPEEKLNKYDVSAIYTINSRPILLKKEINIVKSDFPVYEKSLFLGKFSDLTYQQKPEIVAFIEACQKKKNRAFSSISPDYIGSSTAHPRDIHFITSPFYSKRRYQRYKKEDGKTVRLKDSEKIHYGTDMRGDLNTPVFAIMDGKVVLAEKLHYEGNFLVIDHGNRIFSYYMHMNSITVKEGDMVKAGQLSGRVGSTGVSTGAHLHVSLFVRGFQADPLSILPLPIRD
jgi:murein DD-endopeptidase MepM/ murein hydrolase activator NlpD